MMKKFLMSLLFFSLMTILTSCAKEIHGVNIQWIVIPLLIIFIVGIGIVIIKNYKSLAEEKKLIAEMAIRQKIFAEEEVERQKQLAKENADKSKQQ
jgi:hypothetical protein